MASSMLKQVARLLRTEPAPPTPTEGRWHEGRRNGHSKWVCIMRGIEANHWNRSRSRRTPIGALALAVAIVGMDGSVASANMLYDATAEFNGAQGGTTGVWRYGQLSAAGGTFTELVYNAGYFSGPSGAMVGASFMHSGGFFTGVNANLRFIAPTAGTYTAIFQAKLLDPGNNPYAVSGYPDYRRDGVRMWLNTAYHDLQTWDQTTSAQSFVYQTVTRTFTLQAGGTIDFAIDPNGARAFEYGAQSSYLGYNIYDSTAFMASVEMVPAPAAVALIGLVGIAGVRRRR